MEPTLVNQKQSGAVPCRNTTAKENYLGREPVGTVQLPIYTWREGYMASDEICVCGHPQSLHRTYGCNGSHPNPDPKNPTVSAVSAKRSKNAKLLTVSHE